MRVVRVGGQKKFAYPGHKFQSRAPLVRDAPGFTKGGGGLCRFAVVRLRLEEPVASDQPDGESLTLGSSNFDEVSSRFRRGSVIVYYAW